MNHLDDFTLNEYLDHTLSASDRDAVETHIRTCTACSTRMKTLKHVFSDLESLSETRLEHDLAPTILERMPQEFPAHMWTRAFAGQVGVAVGLVAWIMFKIASFIKLPHFDFPESKPISIHYLLTQLLSLINEIQLFQFADLSAQLPEITFQLPELGIDISNTQMTFIAISTLVLWIVGNFTLIQNPQGAQK